MAKHGTRNTYISSEGFPLLLAVAVATIACWQFIGFLPALVPAALLVTLYFVFRDPPRPVPAVPLGVVSPVDGEVLEVSVAERSILGGEARIILLSVNAFGTYTARCPVEGKVMDLATDAPDSAGGFDSRGLWVRTDEGDDMVLSFKSHRFGIAPRAFIRYGERIGQGQRCAFLRLTRIAEVQVPAVARVQVEVGQRVAAGSDVLAKLPTH